MKKSRTPYLSGKISGIPYSKVKARGNLAAAEQWSEAIRRQTRDLPTVKEPCILKITFLLPADKFPSDLPYGPDLDNLTKRFLDALNKTVFGETQGKDSCVVALDVMKTKVESREDAGAVFEILPVSIITTENEAGIVPGT